MTFYIDSEGRMQNLMKIRSIVSEIICYKYSNVFFLYNIVWIYKNKNNLYNNIVIA